MHPDLQSILSQHQVVFTTPHGIPPSHGVHDHSIPLVKGVFLPMFSLIIITFPRRMKLRKLFKNSSKKVLFVLVPTPILLYGHGTQERRYLAPCVRLSLPQQTHHQRQISHSCH
jgi:hypothetical protein